MGGSRRGVRVNLGTENERVEFKKSTSECREGMESIASMLNKSGEGVLYFGVRNDGEVVGQQIADSTLRKLSQAIGNAIEPRIFPSIEALEADDGARYIRVVFAGEETPYACNGKYRIRSFDEDVPMSRSEVERQFLASAAKRNPWDRRPSGRPISDVDESELRRYVAKGAARGRIAFEYAGVEDALSRLQLLTPEGMLTNAADVCFCPSIDVRLKMGVFADSKRIDILDNKQVSGTLFELARQAEFYILNNTRRQFIIDGSSLEREEIPEIPRAASREAIFNALCHRDYEDLASVQVDIFWDKVAIYNPGQFPAGRDPRAYLEGQDAASLPKNGLIAATLYRSGDIEVSGTGLRRIYEACEAEGVPVRCLQQGMNFRVEFARKEAMSAGETIAGSEKVFGSDGGVNDRINEVCGSVETAGQMVALGIQGQEAVSVKKVSDRINEHVNEHVNRRISDGEYCVFREIAIDPTITYKRLAATLGISVSTARRRTAALRECGIICRVGSDKAGHWQILKPIDGGPQDNA